MFTILYAFQKNAEYIIEVKRTDLAEDAPKDLVYHWLAVDADKAQVDGLVFRAMHSDPAQEEREFEGASLVFNGHGAKFTRNGQSMDEYNVVQGNDIGANVKQLVIDYLISL